MLPEDQRHENHNSANHHPDWKKNKKQPQEDNREDSQQYHGCPGQNTPTTATPAANNPPVAQATP